MPSVRLEEKLNAQGPAVIKSSVWRLLSPAASLSTADARRGRPILHYGSSEKESIAASGAAKSAWTPSGFSVRHQSQTQTDGKKKLSSKASEDERKQNADSSDGAFCDDINKRRVSLQDETSSV